ncbi:MAG: methyltransferase domain-containing protein [Chloroflexi bacterium]|nr:methyltransferase domain-containing protein [Chloroflexota bacterium]
MSPGGLDHFALLAPFYDRVFRSPEPQRLRGLLDPFPSGRLLDLGGGTGRVAGALGYPPARLVLADVSAGMLAQAKSKGFPVVVAAAEALPFRDGAFGRVLMVDAFHHLEDQTGAAAEMWRVLGPQGRAVVEEPDLAHPTVKLIALGERLLLMRSRFRRAAWVQGLFAALGAAARVVQHGANYWVVAERQR